MNKRITGYILSCFMVIILVVGSCGTGFAGAKDTYAGYPPRFDGHGVIDGIAIDKNVILINDTHFQLSSDTNYNRPKNLNCSGRWFKEGIYVYYILEPGTTKILSLWLVKNKNVKLGKP